MTKQLSALGATLILASTIGIAGAHERNHHGHHSLAARAVARIHHTGTRGGAGQVGIASIYWGEKTANGQYASRTALTAAHKSLPFGTLVRVTNRSNGKSVVVRINDRGPYVAGRVIDLTPAGAHAIGSSGLAPVTLAVVGRV